MSLCKIAIVAASASLLSAAAIAEPVALSEKQMDEVTAGHIRINGFRIFQVDDGVVTAVASPMHDQVLPTDGPTNALNRSTNGRAGARIVEE